MEGTIKKVVRDRGFGFIRVQGHEIFFHRTGLQELEFESLKEGQNVEFKLERGDKGLQATNVRISGTQARSASSQQHRHAATGAAELANAEFL